MPEAWFADRVMLYHLVQQHPEWSTRQFAEHLQRSLAWVKKWKHRIGSPPAPDHSVCQSRSRARCTPPPPLSDRVISRILELRENLAVEFNRTVGPKTILYYLRQDADLAEARLPRSATTIWKILDQHQRILHPRRRKRCPLERPEPMTELEVDFADVTTIAGTLENKLQHAVEAFNWLDRGTSRPVASRMSDCFNAVGVIRTCAAVVQEIGLPQRLRCDRDSRFVGNTRTADFPAPFMRFWMNLDVALDVCPPHSPQLKPYVERYNRAFKEECLAKYHPRTVAEAQACADRFRSWYCEERPHQGDACGNQPPDVAFPDLPAMRPVPETIDPDGWLRVVDGMALVRRVNRSGDVAIDNATYYVGKALAGQEVTFQVDAAARQFRVMQHEREIKRLAIRRLIGAVVTFDQMVEQLCQLAERTEAQLRSRQRHRRPRNRLR